ncbi:HNH endonuclease [Spirosoma aerophilum]
MAAWRKLRARVLDNYPFCVHCQQVNRLTTAQMVDHIRPIRLGGEPLDEANLMPLCNRCHQVKRGKERHQG